MSQVAPQSPWRTALTYLAPAALVLAGGFFSWLTGIEPKLAEQGRRVQALELRLDEMEKRSQRVEDKIDRLIRRKE